MSRYDDDYDDKEDERDDDELDDENGVRRSTSNPFSRPSTVRGAGLPQRTPPPSQSGSTPSPIRGAGGANNPIPSRGGAPSQSSGSSPSGVQPYQRSAPPTRSPAGRDNDDEDTLNDRTAAVNRVLGSFGHHPETTDEARDERPARGGTPFSSRLGANDRTDERDERVSGLTRGLGAQTTRLGGNDRTDEQRNDRSSRGGLLPTRPGSNDEPRDQRPSRGGLPARPGSDDRSSRGGLLPTRGSNDEQRDDRSSRGGLPTRFGGNDEQRDDRQSKGGLTSRFGGNRDVEKPSRFGGGNKTDDKPARGGLGGLTSRFGGGKKDDKPAASSLGGFSSRIGSADRTDDKPARGGLGGLTSRFGGKKEDNKPTRFGAAGSADDKPARGLGGLGSRFGGKKPADQPNDRSGAFGTSWLGDQSSTRQSPLGGALSRGARPETSSSAFGGASPSRSTPFGGAAPSRSVGTKTPAPSVGDRLKGLFGQNKEPQRPTRARASKAPRVDQGGLSLDNKLDIVGVTLLLGSLVLLLSSLSPTKGALSESVNHSLSYVFGWGAVFVLMVTFAIGVWLILRHFGDEAPVISRTRLIGMAMLFLGGLVAAQFIDSFQYKVGADQDYLGTLKNVFLPIAYNLGRGGGWVGGEIYFQLIDNFGEIGGFMVLIGWLIVGVMLALRLSASDLAMVVISNVRNFRDVMTRRRQRAAAVRAEKQQALAAVAQQISVSKPAAEQLPLGTPSPALPAPVAEKPRRIPITSAGRTSTVPFQTPELAEISAQPVPVAQEKSGGLFSRVRGVLPGSNSRPHEDKPAAEKASALRGRLLGGKRESTAPAAPPQTPAMQPAASAQSRLQPQMQAAPAPSSAPAQFVPEAQAAPAAPAAETSAQGTPRLGDLLKRTSSAQTPEQTTAPAASSSGVQPYQRTPLTRPEAPAPSNGSVERKPAEMPSAARPQQPNGNADARPAKPPAHAA